MVPLRLPESRIGFKDGCIAVVLVGLVGKLLANEVPFIGGHQRLLLLGFLDEKRNQPAKFIMD